MEPTHHDAKREQMHREDMEMHKKKMMSGKDMGKMMDDKKEMMK